MQNNSGERDSISWWASRHGRIKSSTEGVKRSRRITLLDLLLLVVMAGILVPWILIEDSNKSLGPYNARIEKKQRENRYGENQTWLILNIQLKKEPDAEEAESAEEPVGWIISDSDGLKLHEEWDLPPDTGKSRRFSYLMPKDCSLSCRIYAGGETVVIPVEPEADSK